MRGQQGGLIHLKSVARRRIAGGMGTGGNGLPGSPSLEQAGLPPWTLSSAKSLCDEALAYSQPVLGSVEGVSQRGAGWAHGCGAASDIAQRLQSAFL